MTEKLWKAGAHITEDCRHLTPYNYLANHDLSFAQKFDEMTASGLGGAQALDYSSHDNTKFFEVM